MVYLSGPKISVVWFLMTLSRDACSILQGDVHASSKKCGSDLTITYVTAWKSFSYFREMICRSERRLLVHVLAEKWLMHLFFTKIGSVLAI